MEESRGLSEFILRRLGPTGDSSAPGLARVNPGLLVFSRGELLPLVSEPESMNESKFSVGSDGDKLMADIFF